MVQAACFRAPADFEFGDEPRVDPRCVPRELLILTSRFFKRTRFADQERFGLELRTEFFNLFKPNSVRRSKHGVLVPPTIRISAS